MVLSVPSYVIPGTYLENLRFLENHPEVRAVELLFFSWDQETQALLRSELPEIRKLGERFAFTAHMPSPLLPEAQVLIETSEDLITNFIVHPPAPGQSLPAFIRLLDTWRLRFGDRFLLENTRLEDFDAVQRILPEIPLCMDTGHLLLEKNDPAAFARKHARTIRQIHLHGTADGRDHCAFLPTETWFQELSPFLRDFTGIVELEIFNWDILAKVLMLLGNLSKLKFLELPFT